MYLEKPVMEFVCVDLCDIATSGGSGSGESCSGCDAAMNNCGDFMENNPVQSGASKVKNTVKSKETPKNVVGFDMTFDK